MSTDLELATGQHVELLSVARLRLQEAETIPDITQIVDYAEAVRVTARKVGLSLDAQNDWAEYKLDAERKAGQILADMGERRGKQNSHRVSFNADLGISHIQSHRWQRIASLAHRHLRSVQNRHPRRR
jgi:polygalacturonase